MVRTLTTDKRCTRSCTCSAAQGLNSSTQRSAVPPPDSPPTASDRHPQSHHVVARRAGTSTLISLRIGSAWYLA
jgi:hypothetical protein